MLIGSLEFRRWIKIQTGCVQWQCNLKPWEKDIPGGPVAKTLSSQCKESGVQSLVRELDPTCCNWELACMPQQQLRPGTAKWMDIKKKKNLVMREDEMNERYETSERKRSKDRKKTLRWENIKECNERGSVGRARELGGNPGNSGFADTNRAGRGHVHSTILWKDSER